MRLAIAVVFVSSVPAMIALVCVRPAIVVLR
jgi:hypothetical protein